MRPTYLIANWKMNPTKKEEAFSLLKSTEKAMLKKSNVHVVLCPPFPYLPLLASRKKVELGAQNCFWQKEGPFTGEVSPIMLVGFGCIYVIVGHSERREMGEDNALINKKIHAVLGAGLRPVFAVGEKTHAYSLRKEEVAEEQMRTQIFEGLKDVPQSKIKNIIMVYEPVWAISKGDPSHASAAPQDVFSSVLLIRQTIAKLYSRGIAEHIPVLYGGTTNSKNLLSILQEGHADGALVGGASLDAKEFSHMIQIASANN